MTSDASTFEPNGIITLTSDFGTAGPYVGVIQGVMLGQLPTARIVDITHDTEVHWPAEAGFWIEHAYRSFPAGTVHVAVVESGGGMDRPGIVVDFDGHAFVGPDNGLLACLAEREEAKVYAITTAALKKLGRGQVAPTFRGRDAQAPIGGALAAGKMRPGEVGPEVDDWAPSLLEGPEVKGQEVKGQVVTVDSFGNVVTNITAELVASFAPAEVHVGGRTLPVRRTYGEVEPGEILALVNAFGVLEIARAQKSAADLLGIGRGAPITLKRRFSRS